MDSTLTVGEDLSSFVVQDKSYFIYQVATNQVLDAKHDSGTQAYRNPRGDSNIYQRWSFRLVNGTSDTYVINHTVNNNVLDSDGEVKVRTATTNNPYQQWKLLPIVEGSNFNTNKYWIQQVATGEVLDCGSDGARRRPLQADNLYQQWHFVERPDDFYNFSYIRQVSSRLLVTGDLSGLLKLDPPNIEGLQSWRLEPTGDDQNSFFIYQKSSFQVLDLGTFPPFLRLTPRNDFSSTQRWVVRPILPDAQIFNIMNVSNGMFLTSSDDQYHLLSTGILNVASTSQQWLFQKDNLPNYFLPLDHAWKTYSVEVRKWLGDILYLRSYNPLTIEQAGMLLGVVNGKIAGVRLKDNVCEYLSDTNQTTQYSWVFAPNNAILYMRIPNDNKMPGFVAHSQLGGGKPVYCAGTFKIGTNSQSLESVLFSLDDRSGHYQPLGRECLPPVLDYLNLLGLYHEDIQLLTTHKLN
ncbi:hypothetical protein SAMD00019534_078410 [Acytostelium subglobosum LB1]|uniref:hypothetical protein n=1 Tax=Acytostelium subglobosum LB1 TaxID=1410327 RepID=UPI00064493B1|nr:hypothetical protein SAMD00019534_078410 [Acytostelium subglobosum LB1]GAM24666.1 hypothetical protein SAMD00019534_078410 [Acytostelium subglobosum LB1]|eukprot:XP_012752335.1 hypothetical protein SAMD00019534_078410 [Acytostelium subglobosum LB1]